MKRLTSLLLALCISGSLLSGCKGKEKNTETTSDKSTVETTADPRSESSSEAPSVTTSSETSESSESTTETEPLDPKKQEAIEAAKAHGLTEEDLGGEYEIFLKFQQALEENTTVGEYKEFIYRIFPVIAYASEYVDDSYFFQRVSSLSITKDELEDSINGQYNSENNLYLKTSLFENDPDRLPDVLFHELMHFLDYNINGVKTCVYIDENGKHLSPAEVAYFTDEEMDKLITCPESLIVTEPGAEIYTAKFLTGAPYAYKDGVTFLSCIEYIMGEEYMKKLFFSWDTDALFEELFLEAGYTHQEYMKASRTLNNLARSDLYSFPEDAASPEDLLIDLYTHYKGGNWKEDKKFLSFIKNFNGIGLEGWRRSKNAEFIGGIVYQTWEQFEKLEKLFTDDIPETLDLDHPYPTLFMRDGEMLFGSMATVADPASGEKYRAYVTYEWDFENDIRTGYTIQRIDGYVEKYF